MKNTKKKFNLDKITLDIVKEMQPISAEAMWMERQNPTGWSHTFKDMLSDDLIRGYIGGAGINARLLAEYECPAITELLQKRQGVNPLL